MDEIFELLAEAWEAILEFVFGPAAPGPATGASTWDVACQPLTETEFLSAGAAQEIAKLIDLFPPGATAYDPARIRLKRITEVGKASGRTTRDLATNKDYLIELNSWEDPREMTIRSYYDVTLQFIHELAHVRDADAHGFLPTETAALLTEQEYLILALQFEYSAFRFQLDGARAIYQSDKARFAQCWELSVLQERTLSALQGGNQALARKSIRDLYASKIRAAYAQAPPGPAPAALSNAVNAFFAAGKLDSPSLWGLSP